MVKVVTETSEIPSNGLVVIDFFATWCGPCKKIAPAFEELSKKYTSITFLKVDVDESGDLVNQYSISAMPTFVFLHNNSVFNRIEGADIRGIGQTLEDMMRLPA
jgi:thioredoxin 1